MAQHVSAANALGAGAPFGGASGSASSGAAGSAVSGEPESVADQHDIVKQASKLGFEVNAILQPKATDTVEHWEIRTFETDEVHLVEKVLGEDMRELRMPPGKILKEWRVCKGKIPTNLPGWNPMCSPRGTLSWAVDAAKSAVSLALHAKFAEYAALLDHVGGFAKPCHG